MRNMKGVWRARRNAVLLERLSVRQLRLLGAALGASVPGALALLLLLQVTTEASYAAFLCLYAAAIGAAVGAWRAPLAASSRPCRRVAVDAWIAGVVLGTVLLTAGYSILVVVSVGNLGAILLVLLTVIAAAIVGPVIGTLIGLPSALVSVWLFRRVVGAR